MFKLMRNATIFKGVSTSLQHTSTVHRISSSHGINEYETGPEKTMNKVRLLGRVGKAPHQRGTESCPLVTFSLATHSSESTSTEGTGFSERCDWHQVMVFKPEVCENVMECITKGQRAIVIGRLVYSRLADKNRTIVTHIIADEVIARE